MSNPIPELLNDFEVYEDSTRYLGCANIELPNIEFMTEEISGAAIAGKLDVPIMGHVQSPEVKLTWRTLAKRSISLLSQKTHTLTLRGALQNFDASKGTIEIKALKIILRGRTKSSTLGKFETGVKMDTETVIVCDYLKILLDETVLLEIDIYNYKFVVEGVDYLSDVRSALGL